MRWSTQLGLIKRIRSAVSGRFVRKAEAQERPRETVEEIVKRKEPK